MLETMGGAQALEMKKRHGEGRVRELQANIAELGGEGMEGKGGTGGSELEVLQRELSVTLTDLAKVSTEVSLGGVRREW